MSDDNGTGGRPDVPAHGIERTGSWTVLANEFAVVHLVVDELANGPRLIVFDPTSGRQVALDPLELQALAWSRHEQLAELLAPAFKEAYLHRVDASQVIAGEPMPDDLVFDFEDDD